MGLKILSWNIMGSTWQIAGKLGVSTIIRKFTYQHVKKHILAIEPHVLCLQEGVGYNGLGFQKFLKALGYEVFYKNDSSNKICNQLLLAVKGNILGTGSIIHKGEVLLTSSNTHFNSKKYKPPLPSDCLFVDIEMSKKPFRIYNCQLRIRNQGIVERLGLLEKILMHAQASQGSVVICGDFNTTIPAQGFGRWIVCKVHQQPKGSQIINGEVWTECEKYIFSKKIQAYGFRDLLPQDQPTWGIPFINWNLFNLKLDWFLVKNLNGSAKLGKLITDHRSVLAKIII